MVRVGNVADVVRVRKSLKGLWIRKADALAGAADDDLGAAERAALSAVDVFDAHEDGFVPLKDEAEIEWIRSGADTEAEAVWKGEGGASVYPTEEAFLRACIREIQKDARRCEKSRDACKEDLQRELKVLKREYDHEVKTARANSAENHRELSGDVKALQRDVEMLEAKLTKKAPTPKKQPLKKAAATKRKRRK